MATGAPRREEEEDEERMGEEEGGRGLFLRPRSSGAEKLPRAPQAPPGNLMEAWGLGIRFSKRPWGRGKNI